MRANAGLIMGALMTAAYEPPHTTFNEIDFAKNIGQFSEYKVDELELLRRYKNACLKRANWGDVDKWVILAFIDERIITLSARRWGVE